MSVCCYRVLMHCHDGSVQKRTRRLWSSESAACFPDAETANERILSLPLSFSSDPSPALQYTNICVYFNMFFQSSMSRDITLTQRTHKEKTNNNKKYLLLSPSASFGFLSALAQSNTNGSLSEKRENTSFFFFFCPSTKIKQKQIKGANRQY